MATLTDEEWRRRYEARIVGVLEQSDREYLAEARAEVEAERLKHPNAAPDAAVFVRRPATPYADVARQVFEASEPRDLRDGFEDDPEAAADEEMSYWGDDV